MSRVCHDDAPAHARTRTSMSKHRRQRAKASMHERHSMRQGRKPASCVIKCLRK